MFLVVYSFLKCYNKLELSHSINAYKKNAIVLCDIICQKVADSTKRSCKPKVNEIFETLLFKNVLHSHFYSVII